MMFVFLPFITACATLAAPSTVFMTGGPSSSRPRTGNDRDLMVVLPVMQGNTNLTDSHLQHLYTKPPVTARIEEDSLSLVTQTRFAKPNSSIADKRMDTNDHTEEASKLHPHIGFLFTHPTSNPKPNKSPLDYGYPETFKFIQELNELPRNHKPEWALTDFQESNSELDKPLSMHLSTKGDPFQMFESVKPLDINKMLSFRPIMLSATDSIDEVTKKTKAELIVNANTKHSAFKHQTKKPQKTKLSPQRLSEAELSFLTSTTTEIVPTTTSFREGILVQSDTTKIFLPTPYKSEEHMDHIVPRTPTIGVSTTISSSSFNSRSIPTPNTITPNLQWAYTNDTTAASVITTPKSTFEVQPLNFAALSKILGEKPYEEIQKFQSSTKPSQAISSNTTTGTSTTAQSTTKSPFTEDDLSLDVKNMLISLGIMKSDAEAVEALSTTTTATSTENYLINVFGKQESATPTIDPVSYFTFKKIPVDTGKPQGKVSDDMRDLLTSFGLLPQQTLASRMGYNPLTRVSREFKVDQKHDLAKVNNENGISNATISSTTESAEPPTVLNTVPKTTGLFDDNTTSIRTGHVFQPSNHVESLTNKTVEKLNETLQLIQEMSKTTESTTTPIENITSSNSRNSTVAFSTSSIHTNQALGDPDPLSPKELLYLLESNKNEVKRQEPKGTITSTTTPSPSSSSQSESDSGTSNTSATTSSESVTTTSNNAPLPDLAASFGGGETASEASAAEELPPQRPNGLYFYVDWNSFLNVGEADKNPVRVRFAPRAGNARNFLPITVP